MVNEKLFRGANQDRWTRLNDLVNRGESSVKNLSPDQLLELIRLYRQSSADLALLRTDQANLGLTMQLNGLVGRAHAIIYRRPVKRIGEAFRIALFAAADTMRRRKVFMFVSIAIFLFSVAFNWVVLDVRPDMRAGIIPPQWEGTFSEWKKGTFQPKGFEESSGATAFYMANNPFVSMRMATEAAATFGVGTVEELDQNGKVMGALAHEMNSVGKLGYLLASIFPHGASELNGMFVAGSAGLLLGWSLIRPGQRSRAESMREAGKDALVMTIQAILMMLIAAPFEGFFSFQPSVPSAVKVLVGCIVLTGWLTFWSFYGKTPTPKAAA